MNSLSQGISAETRALLDAVAAAAMGSKRFGRVRVEGNIVTCAAAEAPEPVDYRIVTDGTAYWVEWVTPNRWLSQSIEAELMFTGDDLEDMIEEELIDLGSDASTLGDLAHFRSDDMLYTFRSAVALADGDRAAKADHLLKCLLAYEAAFCVLGDMKGDDEN